MNFFTKSRDYLFFAGCTLASNLAMAQKGGGGGLQKVNTVIDNVQTGLRTISIGVVTIAVMVVGYKLLFAQTDIREIGKIIGGALLIGAAAELARFLLG